MLPYLIAGAIGFGIGKLFENGGETFMAGGRITTNEDLLNSFLTSTKEVKVNNLSTHFNEYDDFLLLRNYYTLIATRKGNDVKITNVKHSKTTSAITNRLKALAEKMGYSVEYVTEKEIYNFDEFGRGRQVKVADYNPKSEKEYDIKEFTEIAIKKYSKQYDVETIKKEINRNKDWYDYTNETQLNNDLRGLLENLRILEVIKKKIKYTNKKYKINDTFNVEFYILFNDEQDAYNPNTLNKPSGYYLQFMTNDVSEFDEIFDEINTNNDKKITISYDEDALSIIMPLFETKSETPTNYKKAIQEGKNKIPVLTEYFVEFLDKVSDLYYGEESENEYADGGQAERKSFGEVYDDVVKYIMADQKISYDDAVAIIDEQNMESWIRDMVESEEEYNAEFLAEQILSTDEGTYAGGGLAKKRRRSASMQYGTSDYDIGGKITRFSRGNMQPHKYKFFREEYTFQKLNIEGNEYNFDLILGFHNGGIDSESGNELPSGYYARIDPLAIPDGSTKHILKKNDFEYSFVGELWNLTMLILKAEEDTKENKNQAIKLFQEKRTDLINEFKEYINDYVLGRYSEYAGGGLAKKRRRSASMQYGTSDRAFDKQLTAKPVGYRFTNAKANQLRKDPYDKPTEAQVKKYLGKGIYKENRKNRSDRDRITKL